MPSLSASKRVKMRRSSMSRSLSPMGRRECGARFSVSCFISAPRTAFMSAASKQGAMAMTSPVAFICGPRLRSEPPNLSKGHFGNFTTT